MAGWVEEEPEPVEEDAETADEPAAEDGAA
jgi:hypothetical protein